MNRWFTVLTLLLAAGALATAISLKSCLPSSRGNDGFVLDLEPSSVKRIRIQSGTDPIELRRKGAGWQFHAGKIRDQANPAIAETLLKTAALMIYHDKIAGGEIQGRDDLSEFGVRSPKRWIEFDGPRPAKILFGKDSAMEGRIYARVDGSNDIFLVDDTLARMADSEPTAFRDPVLCSIDPSQVDRVILRSGPGAETEIQRDASGWKITKPLSAPADPDLIQKFLRDLLGTPLVGIVGDDTGDLGVHGIQEGKNEVALFVEGRETPLLVRFGLSPESKPGTVLAQFTGRDIIANLPSKAKDFLNVGPDDLRDRRLLPVDLDMVDLIRVTEKGTSFDIRRSAEDWEIVQNDRKIPVSPAAIQTAVDALAQTKSTEFLRKEPSEISLSIEFFSVLSENTPETTAGERLVAGISFGEPTDGVLEAVVSGRPGGVSVSPNILNAIPGDPSSWALPISKGPDGN